MDNFGLSHVQTSQAQPNAASSTLKMQPPAANQRKFSLNDAHKQTVQRVHQVQKDLLSLGAAVPLRRLRGAFGPPSSPPPPPEQGLLSEGRTSPSPRPSPLLEAGGGGSMLLRNLDALEALVLQLHWLPCNQTPPCSTGTVSPATPGNNQDVGSRSSWDDLGKN